MGKKFLGLGGTDHIWDRAKAWILNQITSAVAAKIAEVVANAPEDLDTLKEIADWIKAHANDAAAMNTQITENKNNIASLSDGASAMNTQIQTNKNNIAAMNTQITENKNNIASLSDGASAMNTQIQTNKNNIAALQTSVAGKADKAHTHSTGDITSGTLPIANGGTGVTTQADINKAFIGNLETGESDVTDGTEFVSSYASDNGFAETAEGALNTPYKRQFIKVWDYIKGKISSVLGLTKDNYGGKANTAGTADSAATILDSNNGTPIKVRWGGPAIDSAEWYPAFNADGSVLGPINRANIHAGTADTSNLTTGVEYTGEGVGCITAAQTPSSVNNSPADWASYIICNHDNGTTYYHQMLRLPFFSDTIQLQRRVNGELKGWKNVAIVENENTWPHRQNFTTAKASSKMVIPIGAPSSLEDGCIWIER